MKAKVKFEGIYADTVLAKNLFKHNKKNKEKLYLIVAACDTVINMKDLEAYLKTGKDNLRDGDEAVMESLLGVKKGSVNLVALLNDKDKKI